MRITLLLKSIYDLMSCFVFVWVFPRILRAFFSDWKECWSCIAGVWKRPQCVLFTFAIQNAETRFSVVEFISFFYAFSAFDFQPQWKKIYLEGIVNKEVVVLRTEDTFSISSRIRCLRVTYKRYCKAEDLHVRITSKVRRNDDRWLTVSACEAWMVRDISIKLNIHITNILIFLIFEISTYTFKSF